MGAVGLELARLVLGGDAEDLVDLRAQHGVGADAIDSLDRFFDSRCTLGTNRTPSTSKRPRSGVPSARPTSSWSWYPTSRAPTPGPRSGSSSIRFTNSPSRNPARSATPVYAVPSTASFTSSGQCQRRRRPHNDPPSSTREGVDTFARCTAPDAFVVVRRPTYLTTLHSARPLTG